MNARTPAAGEQATGYPQAHRQLAVAYGLFCHSIFAVAIASMMIGLYCGMASGLGQLDGWPAIAVNVLLLAQFPALHSFLLGRAGGKWLTRLAPAQLGRPLATTTFATIASIQILLAFALWNPIGAIWWYPRGPLLAVWSLVFAASWLFLLKAMWDSGLAVQTGFHGWGAVARNLHPPRIPFRPRGSFRYVRQPIYLAFALTLWTGPVWTPDHLVIALTWTLYCLLGPLLKEQRYLRIYGDTFREYRRSVPYWLPSELSLQQQRNPRGEFR
jgi:protein-S-isoprenylcysteine O-methyltransferase Ste14